MTPEAHTLAQQVALLPGFRWAEGMAASDNTGHRWRIYLGHPPILCATGIGHPGYVGGWELAAPLYEMVPDLDDAPTAGCLLAWLHSLPHVVWVRLITKPYQPEHRIEMLLRRRDELATAVGVHLGEAVARALVAVLSPSTSEAS